MAGPARLRLWPLAALVLLGHAVALEWFAREHASPPILRAMAPPMYTRLLQPEAPPAVEQVKPLPPPAPRKRNAAMAAKARPAASAPDEVAQAGSGPAAPAESAQVPAEPVPWPAPASPPPVAQAEPAAPSVAPVEPPQAAAAAASAATALAPAAPAAPASAAPAADLLESWPRDTRLTYQLGGRFRSGELYGDARVQWQRQGEDYQVRVDVDVTLWATLILTSQGQVTPGGLVPRAYEEVRPGRKRRAAEFGDEFLALENGKSARRPPEMQDTASQFVELAHRFATGRETLEVGRSISFWMARPGAVDRWTYDVVDREMLQTPNLGTVEAFHLKPRPLANPRGNVTAEMWFAPSLQYLPVRIKVLMGENAYVDLIVEKIEQQ